MADIDPAIRDLVERVFETEAFPGRPMLDNAEQLIADFVAKRRADHPEIVCLCGSTRFIEQMAVEAWELEKRGAIVLSCHLLPHWYGAAGDHQAEAEGVAAQLDTLHLRKIDIADRVRVINLGGYIGESTRNEINYAESLGKPITYLEPLEQSA